ncbi:hypothetical protein [Pseudoalteromonas umbrosa]|uniref:hypothetical protein n=1 Tax=Pseudoalteromonas umbrosa TaxID=3048489 RepID=UPI0024C219A9|nr:hypothetical protein [Pseudoalteromonas sp. B95]MDK1289831.1 hypothetical protein [Pseudoalteromonas sp. B95]
MEISPSRFIAIFTVLVAAFSFALLDAFSFLALLLVCAAVTSLVCDRNESYACRDNSIILGVFLIIEFLAFKFLIPLEPGAFPMIYLGAMVFGAQLIFCIATFFTYMYRPIVSLKLTGRFQMHYSDSILMWLFAYEGVVCLLALLENTLRNSSPELHNITFVYDNFELLTYLARAGMAGMLFTMLVTSKNQTVEREGV